MKLSDDKPRYVSEIRCKKCKRLLMKGHIRDIEIKCPKCGYVQIIAEKEVMQMR